MRSKIKKFVLENLKDTLSNIHYADNHIDEYGLDKYQFALIYGYSLGLGPKINTALISGSVENFYISYQKYLNYVLEKLPVYRRLVYRKVELSNILIERYKNAWKKNNIIQEHFFISTSKSRKVSEQMGGNIEFIIFSKTGRSIELYSAYGVESAYNEHEVVFKCGTLFKVLEVTEGNKNAYLTMMQEV